ncbi:MAG TPA: hypothetical protein VMS11_11545 [Solirubrobacterales bacterium]|nr:hypothetical protein [Solirubrobacterales bacterium]
MRVKVILSLVVMVLFGALLAGCGGSSDSSSGGAETSADSTSADGTTANANDGGEETGGEETGGEEEGSSKPLTKTQFTAQVNEICIQVPPTYQEELKKLEKGGKKLTKEEENLKAAIPPLESAREQMEAVTPPAGEEQTLEEVISSLEAAIKGLEKEPNGELSGPKSSFAEFQAVTKKAGLETCAGL